MNTTQLFFALAGLIIAVNGLTTGFIKYYIDAKIEGVEKGINSLAKNVDLLVQYMILHEGKIATLEEKTRKL